MPAQAGVTPGDVRVLLAGHLLLDAGRFAAA